MRGQSIQSDLSRILCLLWCWTHLECVGLTGRCPCLEPTSTTPSPVLSAGASSSTLRETRIPRHDGEQLVSLPADKVKQIWAEAVRIFNMNTLSAHLLSHFLGKLNAATQAIPPAPLFYRCLQRDLQAALADNDQNYEAHLTLSQASLEELSWWGEHLEWETSQTETRACDHQLRCLTDGLGSNLYRDMHRGSLVCTGTSYAHQLSGAVSSHTCSEDLPEACLSDLSTPSTDNATVVAYINNMGGTVSCRL